MAVEIEVSDKSCRVYVGNLDYKVTEAELEAAMKEVGKVVSAEIVTSGGRFDLL